MATRETREQYTATIGIECHVQFKTATKLFSGADNDAREAAPNTLVNHIDFGLPGGLPVLNKEALSLACRAAFALGSKPQMFSKFDRKHYFYPDLPMGYQITQYDEPIVLGGSITIDIDGVPMTIGITRAHMEADAGKSTHPNGADYSLVDLNRAGTPLLEIVSEPDMHSAIEAKTYAYELYLRMRYADVSEANLYYGNMRFDVNVSVSKNNELGTRTETKNLNSFRSVEKTVDYEINRQIDVLESGATIVQETRGWDDTAQKTFSQRTKEDAQDYRYMPDPDIPPIVLTQSYIDEIESQMPKLPADYRKELTDIGFDAKTIADVIAVPDTAKLVSRIFATAGPIHARRIAYWMLQPRSDNMPDEETSRIAGDDRLIKLSQMVSENKLSSTAAKEVLTELLHTGLDPELIATEKKLIQVSDEGEIAAIVSQVLAENQKAATDVRNGEMKAIGFLVGQIMKLSKGTANPGLATELIKKQLGL